MNQDHSLGQKIGHLKIAAPTDHKDRNRNLWERDR